MGPRRRHPGDPGPYSSISRGSRRTRLLAAGRRRAIARPHPVGVDNRRCGAGRTDGLPSVLLEGHEPEPCRALASPAYRPASRLAQPQPAPSLLPRVLSERHEPEPCRALAPPAYRPVSRLARPQPASSLRPVDGARDQPDRVPRGVLGTCARLGLASWARRRRSGGTQHRHAGPMVPTVRSSALRGRRAALGAGESAARRLRTTGRRRARPGITRLANAVRNRLVGLRAPARRDIRQQGRSRSARRVRGAGDAAGNRPRGPGRQHGNCRRTLDTKRRDRLAVAAARDL